MHSARNENIASNTSSPANFIIKFESSFESVAFSRADFSARFALKPYEPATVSRERCGFAFEGRVLKNLTFSVYVLFRSSFQRFFRQCRKNFFEARNTEAFKGIKMAEDEVKKTGGQVDGRFDPRARLVRS